MKNSNRNVILFVILTVLVVAVYSVIHVYCKRLKTDIYSENAIYENNRKKQPVNNIISIRRESPIEPTVSPTIEPTISPTIEPSTKPTSRPTVSPSATPTITPTPTPTPTHHEEITDDIVFEYYYEDGNYIYLINQFPIVDEIGKSLQGDKRTQDFKLRFNSAAVGVKYTITAEKLSGSTLDDEWAKMFLVNDGRDVFGFLRDTFMRLDNDFLKGYSSERLAEYCRTHATENFEEYVQAYAKKPDDLLGSSYVLETGIRYYIKHLVSVVDSALQKGYDWDVISEMLWCDITREDYDLLANDFRPED